jgi:hypothetical protein
VLAFGLAALIDAARGPAVRALVYGALALTTLVAVHGMLAYWQQTIPFDGATAHDFFASFRHL